jgi:hypothetical protein
VTFGKAKVGVGVMDGVGGGVEDRATVGVGVYVDVKVSNGLGVFVHTAAGSVGEGVVIGTCFTVGRLHAYRKVKVRLITAKLRFKEVRGTGIFVNLVMTYPLKVNGSF